jgi:hypothetical protein
MKRILNKTRKELQLKIFKIILRKYVLNSLKVDNDELNFVDTLD